MSYEKLNNDDKLLLTIKQQLIVDKICKKQDFWFSDYFNGVFELIDENYNSHFFSSRGKYLGCHCEGLNRKEYFVNGVMSYYKDSKFCGQQYFDSINSILEVKKHE